MVQAELLFGLNSPNDILNIVLLRTSNNVPLELINFTWPIITIHMSPPQTKLHVNHYNDPHDNLMRFTVYHPHYHAFMATEVQN